MTTMPAEETITFLKRMYAAEVDYLASGEPGRRSFTYLAPYFSPAVVLHQAAALPYGGTWRGHGGLERFFVAMGDTWSSLQMMSQRFFADGDTAVVHTKVRARARATGVELEFAILQTVTLGPDGIREIRPFYWDTAAIAAACDATSITA